MWIPMWISDVDSDVDSEGYIREALHPSDERAWRMDTYEGLGLIRGEVRAWLKSLMDDEMMVVKVKPYLKIIGALTLLSAVICTAWWILWMLIKHVPIVQEYFEMKKEFIICRVV
ncbi:hypothetical protein AAMO2058_001220700 [Amorphochlora amoebiformis]